MKLTHSIEEIKKVTDEAHAGPWKVLDLRNAPDGHRDCIWITLDSPTEWATVAEIDGDDHMFPHWGMADAEFIAMARTAIPELVAEVETLRARLERQS